MDRELIVYDLHKKVSYFFYENFVHLSQNRFIALDKITREDKTQRNFQICAGMVDDDEI